jgi:hypothetical protein
MVCWLLRALSVNHPGCPRIRSPPGSPPGGFALSGQSDARASARDDDQQPLPASVPPPTDAVSVRTIPTG